jgi:hypothetical protein
MKRFCQYIVIITLIFAFALPSVVPAQVNQGDSAESPFSQFDIDDAKIKEMVGKAINQTVQDMARIELKPPFLPKIELDLLKNNSDIFLINLTLANFKIEFEKNARERLEKDLPGLPDEDIDEIIAKSWETALKEIRGIIKASLEKARLKIRAAIEKIKACITKELVCLKVDLGGVVDDMKDKITDALKETVMFKTRAVFLEQMAKYIAQMPKYRNDTLQLIYGPQYELRRQTVVPIPIPFFGRVVVDTRPFAFFIPKIRRGINQANTLTSFGIRISNLLFELENEMRKIADIMAKTPTDATEQLTAIKNVIGFKLNTVINLLKQYKHKLPLPPAGAKNRKALEEAIVSAEAAREYIADIEVDDLGKLIEDIGKIEEKRLKALEAELEAIDKEIQESQDLIDKLPTLSQEELKKLLEELEEDSK